MKAGSIAGFAVGLALAGGIVAWNLGATLAVSAPGAAIVQAAAPAEAPASPSVASAKAEHGACCKSHGSAHGTGDCPHEEPQAAAKKECPFLKGQSAAAKDAAYACPMHPEVKSSRRDRCPKCGMFLEKAGVTP